MNWDRKLERIKENLDLTEEGLADILGITPRTLSDFLKGRRPPSGPVKKLIEFLSGDIGARSVLRKPGLNLVIIHGDFQLAGCEDSVDAVLNMSVAHDRNNEFHYVTVEPPATHTKWVTEALKGRGIQWHFFGWGSDLNSQQARDCYFTAITMWLVNQAIQRGLAHVTLAAEFGSFWPLAKALEEHAKVDVTVIRQTPTGQDAELDSLVEKSGVQVLDPPSGRRFGYVGQLKSNPGMPDKVSFGFIQPEEEEEDEGASADAHVTRELFFSWNHMRKKGGRPEKEIGDLRVGDKVSFGLGVNNEGVCAIDVALVKQAPGAPPAAPVLPVRRSRNEEAALLAILSDAVAVCADREGWALIADVGSRISILYSDYKDRLQELGFAKIKDFARQHIGDLEISDRGVGTQHRADCIRMRPAP